MISDNNFPLKEETYEIIGILFKVHNKLGSTYQEKYYQRAIEEELINQKIPYEKEKSVQIVYNNAIIGRHVLDFIIRKKVILETKTTLYIENKSYQQVLAYLNTLQLKVAIIANFRASRLEYKRVVLPEKYLKKDLKL